MQCVMSTRAEKIKLLALGGLLPIAVQLLCIRTAPPATGPIGEQHIPATPDKRVPPDLHLELLSRLQHVEGVGARDLFHFAEAPPVNGMQSAQPPHQTGPTNISPAAVQTSPEVRRIPLVFYGYVLRPGAAPSAFVLDEDQVHVAKQGELIRGRYRLVRFSVKSVTVEDGLTGERQTIPIRSRCKESITARTSPAYSASAAHFPSCPHSPR
jgi:hypothetical protein